MIITHTGFYNHKVHDHGLLTVYSAQKCQFSRIESSPWKPKKKREKKNLGSLILPLQISWSESWGINTYFIMQRYCFLEIKLYSNLRVYEQCKWLFQCYIYRTLCQAVDLLGALLLNVYPQRQFLSLFLAGPQVSRGDTNWPFLLNLVGISFQGTCLLITRNLNSLAQPKNMTL